MLESLRKNKIPTLEQKKSFINNDVDLKSFNIYAMMTLLASMSLFLISMRFFMLAGNI